MELTHNLPIHQCVLEAHTHFHAHFAFKDVHTLPQDRCRHLQDRYQNRVDNETASDPVHLWSSVHYPNGHYSLLLITALSLSLPRSSCRFSSRYLSAHLHRSADGFRDRWWDNKSGAAPTDYHHGDQLSTRSSTLKTPNVLTGSDTHRIRHPQSVSSLQESSSSGLPLRSKRVSLFMSYEGSNGIPSSMRGAWPIRSLVSRENVSHDVEGLEQVYDIISVLPQQRYGTEKPDGLICPQGLKSCKQSQNVRTAQVLRKCFILSQTESDTADTEAAWRVVWSQSRSYTENVKQETYSVVWVRLTDTGYRHFSLVFSLWQRL